MLYATLILFIGMTAGLKNVVEADEVGFNVRIRIGDGVAHTGLRSKVYYLSLIHI